MGGFWRRYPVASNTAASKSNGAASAGDSAEFARANHNHGADRVGGGGAALAGDVGEVISANVLTGSAVAVSSGVPVNVTSITLGPGRWLIMGAVRFKDAGATFTVAGGGISSTSATPNTSAHSQVANSAGVTPGGEFSFVSRPWRANPAVETTYYLVANATFSAGALSAYGSIVATRVG